MEDKLKDRIYLGAELASGSIFKHSEAIEHISNANPRSFEFHLNYVYPQKELWQKKIKRPVLGVLISFTDMDNRSVLGHTLQLGTYMSTDIKHYEKSSFAFRLGTGITYATKTFDLESNRKNNLFSSKFSGLVYLRLNYEMQLTDRLNLISGLGLTHFSNGAFKLPNLGANIVSINFGTAYKLNNAIISQSKPSDSISIKRRNFFNIALGVGLKESQPINGDKYPIYTMMLNYEIQNKGIGSWVMGLDFNQNTSLEDEQEYFFPSKQFSNDFRIAPTLGYVLRLGNFHALGSVGVYIYSPVEPPTPYYQKIGFRYRIFNQAFLGLNLKAHRSIADFFEYTITYRI